MSTWSTRKRIHLALAEAAAPTYDDDYDRTAFATASYMAFEEVALQGAIAAAPGHRLALDLGCGTGRLTAVLAEQFPRVWGCDLSPGMVSEARRRSIPGARYDVFDVDGHPLPFGPNRADLVNAGFGMFSFVANPEAFLRDVGRVLRPGGVLVLSCYNAGTVPHPAGTPWQPALHARVLGDGGVRVGHGGSEHVINARAHTPDGVRALLAPAFDVEAVATLPTLATLLPAALVDDARVQTLCAVADAAALQRGLGLGAYLWVQARWRGAPAPTTGRA